MDGGEERVDRGSRVSQYFGRGITSYEWVYVVPPGRVENLFAALGGEFSNWHS